MISDSELVEKLGKDPYYSVHVKEDGTEKYFGFLEVFHQLHCVVSIKLILRLPKAHGS